MYLSATGLSQGSRRADWRLMRRSACSALYAVSHRRQVSCMINDRVPIGAIPQGSIQGSIPSKPQLT
jgi:hypothetical protein